MHYPRRRSRRRSKMQIQLFFPIFLCAGLPFLQRSTRTTQLLPHKLRNGSESRMHSPFSIVLSLTNSRTCNLDEKEHQKYVKADFGYFAALCAPDAAPAELHTVHDY